MKSPMRRLCLTAAANAAWAARSAAPSAASFHSSGFMRLRRLRINRACLSAVAGLCLSIFISLGPIVVLALLCIGLGVFAGAFLDAYMLPAVSSLGVDTSSVSTAGGALSTTTSEGYWSPGVGTGLVLIGVALGLLLYMLTSVMKVRVVPTFMAGETMASDQQRFAGGDFYETVRQLPLLRRLYGDAEMGAFDGYRLAGRSGHRIVDLLRSWHSGLLPVYVAWVLFGLVAMLLWLLVA